MCNGLTKNGTKCRCKHNCRWHVIETCPICFDDIQPKQLFSTLCKHTFHKQCITTWYESSDDCPICRREQTEDPLIVFKNNVKKNMEEIYMEAIHSLERDVERLRRRRARRDE